VPYFIHESHHADAKYYFSSSESYAQQGRVIPPADIIITPGSTPSSELDGFFSQQLTRRSQKGKEHVKQHARPSATVVSKPTLPNNHETSTFSSSSIGRRRSSLFRSPFVKVLEKPLSSSHTRLAFHLQSSCNPKGVQNKIAQPCLKEVFEGEWKKLRHHGELITNNPSSMYTSVAAPREVWVVQEPNSYAYPTIFYKTPQVLPCDSVIRLPLLDMHAEHAVNTIRADPRLAHLLEKSGIKLQCNYRLPSSRAICEGWWDEAERLIKRKNKKGKNKTQPMFGLGYVHGDSTMSEDEGVNDPR
jgi:hypothetical protein